MYECSTCEEKFTKQKDLNSHIFSVHKERKEREKKYNCSFCDDSFSAIKVLKKHMIKERSFYNLLVCPK